MSRIFQEWSSGRRTPTGWNGAWPNFAACTEGLSAVLWDLCRPCPSATWSTRRCASIWACECRRTGERRTFRFLRNVKKKKKKRNYNNDTVSSSSRGKVSARFYFHVFFFFLFRFSDIFCPRSVTCCCFVCRSFADKPYCKRTTYLQALDIIRVIFVYVLFYFRFTAEILRRTFCTTRVFDFDRFSNCFCVWIWVFSTNLRELQLEVPMSDSARPKWSSGVTYLKTHKLHF